MKPPRPNWRQSLRRRLPCPVRLDEPLSRHTTFGLGGPAAFMAWPRDEQELDLALRLFDERGVPRRVLGRGSNLLVADSGFGGAILRLAGEFLGLRLLEENRRWLLAEAGGGADLARLTHWISRRGGGELAGLWGIPATVGGAVKSNASTKLACISRHLIEVRIMDGCGARWLPARRLHFAYRRSSIGPRRIVLSARFRLPRWPAEKIARQLSRARALRAGQPRGVRSAGCFFRNPDAHPAGWLIDRAGCRGMKEGRAMVSDVHANFLVNPGGARAGQIARLSRRVAARVYRAFGVRLRREVELWGDFSTKKRKER